MLHCDLVRPGTIDRIQDSWICTAIERHVIWMAERNYAAPYVRTRVQILIRFGEFAGRHGATALDQLPEHLEPFVEHWVDQHRRRAKREGHWAFSKFVRRHVHQMLTLLIPEYGGRPITQPDPFVDRASGYFRYLQHERGLTDSTLVQHRYFLRRFETHLARVGTTALGDLSPPIISAFVADSARLYSKRSVGGFCRILKVFLRYLHREGLTGRDLSDAVESPRLYRLSDIPRSISWQDVRKVLEAAEQCNSAGKRDYAILLLLATYGLRAREVAALTLGDIDWKHDRLRVPGRKAGHSTAFPLSAAVGNAITDYLKTGRPKTGSRRVFFSAIAPHAPTTVAAVSLLAKRYLAKVGIKVHRPGSHTFRHSCVQRLLDSHLSMKAIGDYVGHKSAEATQVYIKIDLEALREVSLGDVEAIL